MDSKFIATISYSQHYVLLLRNLHRLRELAVLNLSPVGKCSETSIVDSYPNYQNLFSPSPQLSFSALVCSPFTLAPWTTIYSFPEL